MVGKEESSSGTPGGVRIHAEPELILAAVVFEAGQAAAAGVRVHQQAVQSIFQPILVFRTTAYTATVADT